MPRRPLTVADLEPFPDDGHRNELLDGTLIVSPAPSLQHQRVHSRFMYALTGACPEELEVFSAPTDVALGDDTCMQPDLLVVRTGLTGARITEPPVLVVEILSPSSRLIDLNLKRARYERAGVPSYWVIDPDGPSLVAWELRDDSYVEVASTSAGESWSAERPFAVSVDLAALVG